MLAPEVQAQDKKPVADKPKFATDIPPAVAIPAASLSAMRKGIRSFGPDHQTIVIFESLMDSRSLFLTANTESIYTIAWINLKDGPVDIESPPNTLGGSTISGSVTSPTWATPARTRARVASSFSCRRATRARRQRKATSSSRHPPTTTGS
jgi:hypothetical protein